MNRTPLAFALLGLLVLGSPSCRQSPTPNDLALASLEHAPVDPADRMAWWREARFGMFIHWGLYAIPAGEWTSGPKAGRDHAEWIRETAQIPLEEYEKLQARFDPVRFDAELWARTAADAGMKYLVITSKHHDGFCLFDSKWTDWDVGGTPFRRDILKELSAACARHGVRFCTYHSIMDWHHPDYLPRRTWEGEQRPAAGADMARFEEYLHHQVEEIVTRYHPGVLWFDGEWESTWNHERGLRLFELSRKLDPAMIVNNRVDVHRGGMGGFSASSEAVGDFATPEQEIPATGMPGLDWETCMTMNEHWGYNAADASWKSAEDLIRKLADIASKGGNFLLNVGPRADGTFPPEAVARLAEIGAWMRQNAESIRGTTASPFDALPYGRCTVKAGPDSTRLYLHVFEWPKDRRLVLPGLGNETVRAWLLAQPGADLACERQESDVWIGVPEAAPDPIDSVVVLEVRGAPLVHKAPTIQAESDIFVTSLPVTIVSGSPSLEVRYTLDGKDPTADSPLYGARVELSSTTSVRARAFHGGKPVSSSAVATFTRVEPDPVAPLPAEIAAAAKPGAVCWRYEGEWDQLPELDRLSAAVAEGQIVDRIEITGLDEPAAANRPGERIALRFRGMMRVWAADVFTFELASDDGSRLRIDEHVVVDNDGLHSLQAKRGRVALAPGFHEVEVSWFNRTGGAALRLRAAPLGGPMQPVITQAVASGGS